MAMNGWEKQITHARSFMDPNKMEEVTMIISPSKSMDGYFLEVKRGTWTSKQVLRHHESLDFIFGFACFYEESITDRRADDDYASVH